MADVKKPEINQTRRGAHSPRMNDAFVKAYRPDISSSCPWWVVWPKGNAYGEGGWYTEEDVMNFWPEVVPT